MARSIGTVRDHAPYVYLTKTSADSSRTFVMFMMVSVANGKKVVYNNTVNYAGGVATIDVSVQNDNNATAGRFTHKLDIDFTNDNNYNPATYAVRVNVTYTNGGTSVTYTSKYILEDAVDVDPTNGDSGEKTAYECPYLYLTNPNAESGQPGNNYNPCCLVPVKNYDKNTESYTESGGQFEQTINLSSSAPPSGTKEIPPSWISANAQYYSDTAPVDKFFEVTVNYTDGKKKKGIIRNVSSDTNPNSFIDTNPFF